MCCEHLLFAYFTLFVCIQSRFPKLMNIYIFGSNMEQISLEDVNFDTKCVTQCAVNGYKSFKTAICYVRECS